MSAEAATSSSRAAEEKNVVVCVRVKPVPKKEDVAWAPVPGRTDSVVELKPGGGASDTVFQYGELKTALKHTIRRRRSVVVYRRVCAATCLCPCARPTACTPPVLHHCSDPLLRLLQTTCSPKRPPPPTCLTKCAKASCAASCKATTAPSLLTARLQQARPTRCRVIRATLACCRWLSMRSWSASLK